MEKMKLFWGILICMLVMVTHAEALGGESYSYITEANVSGTTTRQQSVSTAESNATLSSYTSMQDYTGKYVIPGLKTTLTKTGSSYYVVNNRFAPQGICVAGQYLLISAYDVDNVYNSVIYVLDVTNNKYIMTIVLPMVEHVGGIAYDSDKSCIWVCNGGYVSYFSYNLLKTAATTISSQTGSETYEKYGISLSNFAGSRMVKTTASYCTYFDGMLWVGEFDETTTSDIYAYTVSSSYTLTAKYIMEAPAKTQGMCFYKSGNTVYLVTSCSYKRNIESQLIIYKPSYSSPQDVSGQTYDRILKNTRVKTLTFSPMTEGICISGSKMYVLLESGAIEYSSNYKVDHGIFAIDQYLIYNVSKITL